MEIKFSYLGKTQNFMNDSYFSFAPKMSWITSMNMGDGQVSNWNNFISLKLQFKIKNLELIFSKNKKIKTKKVRA